MEQNITDLYDKAKNIVKKSVAMKFYNVVRPLYLETNASSIGLWARLLQEKDDINCRYDEKPDNVITYITAFTRKNLSSVEQSTAT